VDFPLFACLYRHLNYPEKKCSTYTNTILLALKYHPHAVYPPSIPSTLVYHYQPGTARRFFNLLVVYGLDRTVYGEADYWSGEMVPYILVALSLLSVIIISFFVLLRNLQQEYRLGQLKNDFISSMSHELRSPIATISIALEALSNEDTPPEQSQEFLKVSKIELERLTLLVDRVLRLSMFEEREPTHYPEPLDLYDVVQQVLKAIQLRAGRLDAKIRFEPQQAREFLVQGDRLHLTSVIFNLLDNALKYVNRAPQIDISLIHTDKRVVLRMADNGIGIPNEFQKRIFEKFFRIPADRSIKASGHGLGLSYVARVLEQHGGSIQVDSTPGEGSTFIVELPALP
jgi:two-component system, OmpR family, phosphate regulon sensor histidine kinase PhoR